MHGKFCFVMLVPTLWERRTSIINDMLTKIAYTLHLSVFNKEQCNIYFEKQLHLVATSIALTHSEDLYA
jgi:hypothetical protein